MLKLSIIAQNGEVRKESTGELEARLVYEQTYEEGDKIVLTAKTGEFFIIQLDDAIGEEFVFFQKETMEYEVPFGEKKICYSPKAFFGEKHLMTARYAYEEEVNAYKNLARNRYDRHGEEGCFPHASANVETRGESVFAAKNAINGNCENRSHGAWPFESWGINRDPQAAMKVEFGRKVSIDKLRLYTRADFPHDAWWEQVTIRFSDASELVWNLEKSELPHEITFSEKEVEWLMIADLIKAEDPSPFPALTQLEAYGREV